MKLKQETQKQTLKSKALKNATVSFKEQGTKDYKTTKQGAPLENSTKVHGATCPMIGVNLGVTKNMGDYESLRVDVWLTDTLQQGETVQDGFARVADIAHEVLEEIVTAEIE